jgi:hypothetical protein
MKKTLKSSKRKERQVFLDHVEPIWFLLLVHTITSIKLNTEFDTFRIGNCVWVVLLSPAVLSYHTSLPSFVMLIVACVFV